VVADGINAYRIPVLILSRKYTLVLITCTDFVHVFADGTIVIGDETGLRVTEKGRMLDSEIVAITKSLKVNHELI